MAQTVVNALTVDVEDWFQVAALAGTVPRDDWPRMESRVERNTERLLAMFEQAGVRATFFVLGWIAERHPSLVRMIAAAGHEIASHGYSHRLIYDQTPADFRAETRRGKAILEDQVQQTVLGYRAASYSITKASLWALDEIAEAGFSWDSSIFPVHHDRYGIAGFERWPHRLQTPSGFDLIEFPLTTWRIGGIDLPIAGGGYFRLYPYWLTHRGLRSVNRREGKPFVFYLHPWEVDPGQPRVRAPALSRFRHYNNLSRCAPRLERLLQDFSFAPAGEVLARHHLDPVPVLPEVVHA
jgi:polysaccharide deacetylase family protein (PEP-CTERM system associated)